MDLDLSNVLLCNPYIMTGLAVGFALKWVYLISELRSIYSGNVLCNVWFYVEASSDHWIVCVLAGMVGNIQGMISIFKASSMLMRL